MKTTCWKLFSYLLIDRSTAQARLDQWAREGWALEHVYFGVLAKLRATERTDLTYFLDWTDPKFQEEGDYLQLCADAGWEPVQTIDYLNVYASKPGMDPTPIQTDPAIEYQRFRKKVLRRMGLAILVVLAILAINAFSLHSSISNLRHIYPDTAWERFFQSILHMVFYHLSFFAIAFFLPFWCVGGLAYFLLLFHHLIRWKLALKKGVPPPRLSPLTSRIWSVIHVGGWLSSCSIFLFFLFDALFSGFLSLGTPIGFLVGSFIAIVLYRENPRIRRRSLIYLAYALCLLLCCLLHHPFRSLFDGRIPPPPAIFLQETETLESTRRADGPLGSSGKWEYTIDLGYDPSRQAHQSTTVYLTAETYVSPKIAQAAMEPIPQYLSPVEGVDGLWCNADQENTRGAIFLRRGNTQITAQYYAPDLTNQVLWTVETWMEELEPQT